MITNVLVDGVHRLPIEIVSNRRSDIIEAVSQVLNQSSNEFYLTQNGKIIRGADGDDDDDNHINWEYSVGPICVHQRVFGGKGGFGSMLRAIGAQIEKTTNREACRDLSGRRLRDINEEKRLKDYLDKQKDRQDDEASKIARKIERLRSKPKHEFTDSEYFETRSNLLDDVSSALEDGLKKTVASKSSTSTVTTTSTATATTTSAISSGTDSSRDQDSSSDGHAAARGTSTSLKRKNLITMQRKLKTKKKKKNVKGALWLDEGLSSGDSSDDNDDDHDDSNDGDDDKNESNSNSSSTKTDKK